MSNQILIITLFLIILTLAIILYLLYGHKDTSTSTPKQKPSTTSNSTLVKAGSPEFEAVWNKPGILSYFLSSRNKALSKMSNSSASSQFISNSMLFTSSTRNNREPIIIVPGLGGTQLVSSNTSWSKMNECNWLEHDDGTIWVSVNPPPGGDCQLQMIKNQYNPSNNMFQTNPATHIKVNGEPGSINSCRCLNDDIDCLFGEGNYMKNLMTSLQSVGYKANVDLYAVGYDFRLQPQGNVFDFNSYANPDNYFGNFFLQLKHFVELEYNNTKKKVCLLGHSMGCFMVNLFLNLCRDFESKGIITPGWVDKYIGRFIAVAPAFEGGPKALRTVLCGDNPGTPLGSSSKWQSVERSLSGPISMIPLLDIAYQDNISVSVQGKGSVNSAGLATFLSSTGQVELNNISNVFKGFMPSKLLAYQDPKVPVNLVYGNNIDTEFGNYTFNQKNNVIDFSKPVSMSLSKGDGTVPLTCLQLPLLNKTVLVGGVPTEFKPWGNVTQFTVSDKTGEHLDIIKLNKNVIKYITDLISS